MQLDRSALIKAIKFLKPAILKADEEESNISEKIKERTFIHVKFDGDKCQLTAYDGHCGKSVIIEKPPQLMIDEVEEKPYESVEMNGVKLTADEFDTLVNQKEFLIPRETIEAFEILCTKHKAKFEKVSRRDHSLKLIEIGPHSLDSHKDVLNYLQPVGVHFPNIDPLFFANAAPVTDIKINSMIVIDALKEFNNHVEVTFAGSNSPVYICTEDKTYQAFFMPVGKKEVEDGD